MLNMSFESDDLSSGIKVATKKNVQGIQIPQASEIDLGDFASPCFKNATVCSGFSVSFLVYIVGPVNVGENMKVLDSNSSFRGSYHVQFIVRRTAARLEGHAYVVGGNSSTILDRKIAFPATDTWIHVAMVYSAVSTSLELYVNSVMVTAGDAVVSSPWQSDNSAVHLSLGSRTNVRDIFVSYLQVIKSTLTATDVAQLEKESREQGKSTKFVRCTHFPGQVIFGLIMGKKVECFFSR